MKIEYSTSVFIPGIGAWRQVTIRATARAISAKRCAVVEVLAIDGEPPAGYQSRTGAKRQTFHAAGIAWREAGKVKNLSSCARAP